MNTNPNYDRKLAGKLGGDDYGMKQYFWVILKTGSNTTTVREFIEECFRGHMDNINRLAEEGTLIVAGPLGKNENNYRGIFILDKINSIDDAKELLQTDPALATGQWVSLDVPLSSFAGLTTRGHLAQMIISGDPNTVYVDNIYSTEQ